MGKLFRIIIVSISLSCIYVSLINDYPYIYLLIAIFLIWINNILYGLEHFRRRIIFLGFNLTMFFFLLDRPLISEFTGIDWVANVAEQYYANANVLLGLIAILVSLYAVWIGALLGNQYYLFRKDSNITSVNYNFRENLRFISCFIFIVSMFFLLARGLEKVVYIQSHTYTEYFSTFQSSLPYMTHININKL